jgi:hypothetical protein
MRSLFRIVMLWIVIASLPVQGIAAAIKLPCTMAHTGAASPGVEPMDDCDEPGMAMSAAQPGMQEQVIASTDRQATPCDKDSGQKHSSCRSCAGCHMGTFAPPSFAGAAPASAHFTYDYSSPASSFKGWIPARIDRPPRP